MCTSLNNNLCYNEGLVTKKVLRECIYATNKRAKQYRDTIRELRESLNRFRRNSAMCDGAQACIDQYSSVMKKYYGTKEKLLSAVSPTYIHRQPVFNDITDVIDDIYFLFFIVDGAGFHIPIASEDVKLYTSLPIKEIPFDFTTYCVDTDDLVSDEICQMVCDGLMNKTLRLTA